MCLRVVVLGNVCGPKRRFVAISLSELGGGANEGAEEFTRVFSEKLGFDLDTARIILANITSDTATAALALSKMIVSEEHVQKCEMHIINRVMAYTTGTIEYKTGPAKLTAPFSEGKELLEEVTMVHNHCRRGEGPRKLAEAQRGLRVQVIGAVTSAVTRMSSECPKRLQ